MSIRNITLLTKQNNQPSSALPASAATGEALVNTADGKLYYKGFISGTGATTYLPSLLNGAFFEVGSHISQLSLDDKIVTYSGQSGANLVGKFLSGTSTGFVLANISSISASGPNVTLTGGTFNNNSLVLTNSTGGTVSTFINNFSGLTVNGIMSAATFSSTTFFVNGVQISAANLSANTFTTGATYNPLTGALTITRNDGISVSAIGWSYVTASTLNNNVFSSGINGSAPTTTTINAATGGTYSNGTITLLGTGSVGSITGLVAQNTYTTAGTFTNNNLILTNNTGGTVTTNINNFTGLTVTGPTNISGTTTIGASLTATNLFTSPTGQAIIGTGGMIIGSGGSEGIPGTGDLVVNGSITVFGQSVSAFTSHLYIEDNNIRLNYNPTGNTSTVSLGAGVQIQNGLGVAAITGDTVFFDIAQTGVPANAGDAYVKRFWETNLFNIMVGSSGGTGTGQYVLVSSDILNGGSY